MSRANRARSIISHTLVCQSSFLNISKFHVVICTMPRVLVLVDVFYLHTWFYRCMYVCVGVCVSSLSNRVPYVTEFIRFLPEILGSIILVVHFFRICSVGQVSVALFSGCISEFWVIKSCAN